MKQGFKKFYEEHDNHKRQIIRFQIIGSNVEFYAKFSKDSKYINCSIIQGAVLLWLEKEGSLSFNTLMTRLKLDKTELSKHLIPLCKKKGKRGTPNLILKEPEVRLIR